MNNIQNTILDLTNELNQITELIQSNIHNPNSIPSPPSYPPPSHSPYSPSFTAYNNSSISGINIPEPIEVPSNRDFIYRSNDISEYEYEPETETDTEPETEHETEPETEMDYRSVDDFEEDMHFNDSLYDYKQDIGDLNAYKNDNQYYFINTINDLNKELQNLYTRNLKLTNNNYYLENKSKVFINSIQNYKDIILSHKKYIKDLYQNKHDLIKMYDRNIHNLKNIIQSQNTVLNKFKDSLKCCICYNHNINTIFTPCNHCVMCNHCYEQYITYDNTCPLCKVTIQHYTKIFLPNLN